MPSPTNTTYFIGQENVAEDVRGNHEKGVPGKLSWQPSPFLFHYPRPVARSAKEVAADDPEMKYYAHSLPDPDRSRWQTLRSHLLGVARLASEFADAFGASDWGFLAGLWHDLGKYSSEFQRYLGNVDGEVAHIEGVPGRVNHSSAGAAWAVDKLGKAKGRILAYCIMGHHAGLPDFSSEEQGGSALRSRLERADEIPAFRHAVPSMLGRCRPPTGRIPGDPAFWIRMLFSCLVDADVLDTERATNAAASALREKPWPDLAELECALDAHMDRLVAAAARESTPINRIRAAILARCREAAEEESAIRTLSVPTGGGKTLASLSFALRHARRFGRRRVIYVIPYTSIIEQTASVFRSIKGFESAVVEHHSNLNPDDPARETPRSRLASENWDAPIVVTTAVQFFESLFANRPATCRKLHRIARSVVILDEAHTFPTRLLQPIVRALTELHTNYKTTLVLMTATQPALESVERPGHTFAGLVTNEIMKHPVMLHKAMKRVAVRRHTGWPGPVCWSDLAQELAAHERVLCIVNRKDDARTLFGLMPPGTFHLSTWMCGAHRMAQIETIRRMLKETKAAVRVVSTQLIEAGVDVDFPVVYRASAGLDSISQAAGRCNREGLLPSLGRVVVFRAPSRPPQDLEAPEETGSGLLERLGEEAFDPEVFRVFFRELFYSRGQAYLDKEQIGVLLAPDQQLRFQFATAADRFQMIPERGDQKVVVPYGEGPRWADALVEQSWDAKGILRRLQRFIVSIPRWAFQRLEADVVPCSADFPGLWRLSNPGLYRDDVGLETSIGLDGVIPPERNIV